MLFLKEKSVAAFILLKDQNVNWHLSKIARQSNSTYIYITKLMNILEKKGFVILETCKNRKIVKLTEKGLALANLLDEIKKQLY
ncbi:MAG: hypothetical protein AB1391_01595 [Candidatus Micrarchaeota archaeon]